MLSLHFLLFKSYEHFNKGNHLLSALVNVTKNVGGPNCQISTKTFFLINLDNHVKYVVLKDPYILNHNVK
jgi:hypothetical protein